MRGIRLHSGARSGGVWIAAAILWLLPLLAMQLIDDVKWGAGDFIVFAVMLLAACISYEAITRHARGRFARLTWCALLSAGFLLIWAHLAVNLFD